MNKPSARRYKDNRQKELAIIHAGKRQLGLDDDIYRDFLSGLTGKRSAGELTQQERLQVIQRMDELGGKTKHSTKRVTAGPDRQPMLKKVYALLYHMDLPIDYAETTLKNMFGEEAPDKLEWANPTQLHKLISALEYHKRRNY